MTSIPILDLHHFTQGTAETRQQFIRDLGRTYEEIGFAAIRNHRLSDELTRKLYEVVQAFFHLPDAVKQQYEIEGMAGQRGYTSKGKEHARHRSVGDLKEFYHVGQEVRGDNPPDYPANVWPEEVPEFKPVTLDAYRALEDTGRDMLRAIALYLELDENYFEPHVYDGNSILRPIHYFPIEDPDALADDAVRSAEHEDINLITLLMGASAEGLQVLNRQGDWIDVTAVPESVVVNVGDMLQRLTNNKLRSTTHRVINPPREKMNTARFSIPFFLHPRAEMDLTCLPSCIDAQNPKQYEDITAGEYLLQRLREIGLLK